MRAFEWVREAVAIWGLPEQADAEDGEPGKETGGDAIGDEEQLESAALPAVAGASVILREGGRIVGRGTALADEAESPIRLATREAMREAARRLDMPRDALQRETMRAYAEGLTISLELAGRLVPLGDLPDGGLDPGVEPGVEGVAVRVGERQAAMFPATMLATGRPPATALSVLLTDLTGERLVGIVPPEEARQRHDGVFYRFGVTHLAQIAAGESPRFLHRGGRTVRMPEITTPAIRTYADRLAGHMLARIRTGEAGARIIGTLEPTRSGRELLPADGFGTALAAMALSRYGQAPGVDSEAAEVAAEASASLLRGLLDGGGEAMERDPIAAALALGVALESGYREGGDPDLDPWRRVVEGVDLSEDLPPGADGLLAWSLAVRAAAGEVEREEARLAVRGVFRRTDPASMPAQMPWLGWAELLLAEEGERVPAGVALREMRDHLWVHQLTPERAGVHAEDLVGGIVFTATARPAPTWQSARPLAFAGTMLADERLTPASESARELARLLSGVRFLRQLAADEVVQHMYTDAGRGAWGVRLATWEQRMPVEAGAMTLLALCETLGAIDHLARRGEE